LSGQQVGEGMAARTQRVEARIETEVVERIRRAAAIAHTSMSSFLVAAASEKADAVLAREYRTVVPADYFDELLAALDQPPEVLPALADAGARARTLGLLNESNLVGQ
jgi:uncharacterized protein (DUF1778 family)